MDDPLRSTESALESMEMWIDVAPCHRMSQSTKYDIMGDPLWNICTYLESIICIYIYIYTYTIYIYIIWKQHLERVR